MRYPARSSPGEYGEATVPAQAGMQSVAAGSQFPPVTTLKQVLERAEKQAQTESEKPVAAE
jgi:hypothetical protein